MRFLIFATLLMLNGNYIVRGENEVNVKQAIMKLLNDVEKIQKDIKDILKEEQRIQARLSELHQDISTTLEKNPLVIQGMDALKEGKTNGDIEDKCQALFNLKMEWLIQKVYQYLKTKINKDLQDIENVLKPTEKELDELKNNLVKLLNSKRDSNICKNENQNCKVLDEFANNIDANLKIVNGMKNRLPYLIQNSLYYLGKEEVFILIREEVLLPVIECL